MSIKIGDVEATFDKELAQVEKRKQLYVVTTYTPETIVSNKKKDQSEYDQITRIAEVSPRAAITEAWRKVENTIDQLSRNPEDQENHRVVNREQIVRSLIQRKQLPNSFIEDYHTLRNLRNKAVHLADFSITQAEAERYVRIAFDIAEYLSSQ